MIRVRKPFTVYKPLAVYVQRSGRLQKPSFRTPPYNLPFENITASNRFMADVLNVNKLTKKSQGMTEGTGMRFLLSG